MLYHPPIPKSPTSSNLFKFPLFLSPHPSSPLRMSQEARCNAVYNLMRRMPTKNTTKSLSAVMSVAPELADDILPNIDEPLRVVKDSLVGGRDFVVCDYNRDGDSYRSPYSNKYFDPETGRQTNQDFFPSEELRKLEETANVVFDRYRDQYFQGGISSVYFFDCEDGFGACWLVHKEVPGIETLKKGWWDSSHIFDVQPVGNNQYKYTLTSTVLLSMQLEEGSTGVVDLSGSLSMQVSKTKTTDKWQGHIQNMGPMLEESESLLRNRIESIYIQKTREILCVRSNTGQRDAAFASIAEKMKERLGQK